MNLSRSLLIVAMLISIVVACSPTKDTTSQQVDAINEIRGSLKLPELPLDFVEKTQMGNSPSGDLEVANFRDSDGRIYSVNPKTNQIVEIDARSILATISPDAPSLLPEEIKVEAMSYVKAIIPNFETQQSLWQYDEIAAKGENYFFTWYGKMTPGLMNRPFLQFGIHKSGALFAYYNTLVVEK